MDLIGFVGGTADALATARELLGGKPQLPEVEEVGRLLLVLATEEPKRRRIIDWAVALPAAWLLEEAPPAWLAHRHSEAVMLPLWSQSSMLES